MRPPQDSWLDTFRALGEALFEVFRSEWGVLRGDWRRSIRALRMAGLFLGTTAALAFTLICLLVYAAVHFVAQWLEVWLAALVVAGVVLLAAGLCWWRVLVLWRRSELIGAARRRYSDHLDWWDRRLLRDDRALDEGDDDGTV